MGAESTQKAGQAGGKEGKPHAGTCTAGSVRAASSLMSGMQGAKPPAKLTYSLPPSHWEGGRGGRIKAKGGVSGRERKRAPPQVHLLYGRDNQCRKRSNAGVPGAKPPAKLTYSLPLPRRGRGSGGWGGGIKAKGRSGGRQRRQARTGAYRKETEKSRARTAPSCPNQQTKSLQVNGRFQNPDETAHFPLKLSGKSRKQDSPFPAHSRE